MKRTIVTFALAVAACGLTYAQEKDKATAAPAPSGQKRQMASPAQVRKFVTEKLGGQLRDYRAQKGRCVIINAQGSADEGWLKQVAEEFGEDTQLKFEVEKGEFSLKNPKTKGEVNVFVIDDPELPMSLLATESHWGLVNVSRLRSDKPAFFRARVQKEIVRVASFLIGAGDSQYPMALTGAVKGVEDLDKILYAKIPYDVQMRIEMNSHKVGLKPWKMSNYRQACKEGWAHAPTNEFQQAIWKETLTLPKTPMKIEFDPKKDK